MPLRFPRLLGAHRDAVELQYVAALLQTTSDKSWRSDGTVTALDIRRYLTSRHGFRVDTDLLEREILETLVGTRRTTARTRAKTDDATPNINDSPQQSKSKHKMKKKKKKFNARKVRYHGGPVQRQTSHREEEEDDDELEQQQVPSMDIVQLASLIISPELVQMQRSHALTKNDDGKPRDNDNEDNGNPLALMQLVLEVLAEELAFLTPPDEVDKIMDTSCLLKQTTMGASSSSSSQSKWKKHRKGSIRLTRQVLIRLFRAVGEDPAHWTQHDLSEMLHLASGAFCRDDDSHNNDANNESSSNVVYLDAATLLRAVTSDVCRYPVERCQSLSLHYHDVMWTVENHEHCERDKDDNSKVLTKQQEEHEEPIVAKPAAESSAPAGDEEVGQQVGLDRVGSKRLASLIKEQFLSPLTLGTAHERIFTLASLDQAADTQRSLVWSCLSWLALVAIAFAYMIGTYEDQFDYETNLPNLDCSDKDSYSISEFGCKCVNGIIRWFQVFLEITVWGGTFMVLSQLGNNVYASDRSRWKTTLYSLIGIVTVTFTCILSYFYRFDTNFFNTEGPRNVTHVATFGIGVVLVLQQIVELVRLFLPMKRFPRLLPYFVSGSLKREQSTKHAASFKTSRMLTNAVGCFLGDTFDQHDEIHLDDSCDKVNDTKSGSPIVKEEVYRNVRAPLVKRLSSLVHEIDMRRSADADRGITERSGGLQASALMYYHDHMDETAMTGGVAFFWRNLLGTRSMIKQEGLWLSARLITANLAQWIVAAFVIPALFYAFYRLNDDGSDIEAVQQAENIDETDAIPGIFLGGIAALLVSWLTALIYIPMAMSTILQMRSGYLGNFFEQRFQLFRKSTDRATALFGSALWGSLFSAALAWGIVGGLVFVFLWKDIRDEVLNVLSEVIGFSTTFAFKWLMLKVFRSFWFSGLYRRKPGAANIFHLVLECWNIALSSGFMILRIVRLLLTAVFYVGRMDTPFLAEGVGVIFNSPLDSYPMAFRRDLIVHEAHRHPWIERLGSLYMMKLQHGKNFGRRGGAAWRTIFVLALLPWLRKHRQAAPLCLEDLEEGEVSESEMYGADSLESLNASVRMSVRRSSSIAMPNNKDDATVRLLAENQNLVTENHVLQRQVMELQSRLNREQRKSTLLNKARIRASMVSSPAFEEDEREAL